MKRGERGCDDVIHRNQQPGHQHRQDQCPVGQPPVLGADRLPITIAANFAAQLPELLRGVFYDGWSPSRVPIKFGPS